MHTQIKVYRSDPDLSRKNGQKKSLILCQGQGLSSGIEKRKMPRKRGVCARRPYGPKTMVRSRDLQGPQLPMRKSRMFIPAEVSAL